jgi:predicted aspartyl protease
MLRGRRFSRRRLLFGKVTESGPQGRRRFTDALMGFRSTLAVMICGLFLFGGSVRAENLAPVAQRAVLYDEDPSNPKGKQYVGSVVWRTEPLKATGNQKPDIAVRADIVIPDRKFKMTISFRRITDPSLPASHTVELTFILPPDFAGGGVGNVPGILMKSNEQARGKPLAGLAVKVTDGFFLVELSNVDDDRQRNIQLLNERSWLDVPMVYTNQRRAIIAIEKGPSGEQAFNDAFAFWGQSPTSGANKSGDQAGSEAFTHTGNASWKGAFVAAVRRCFNFPYKGKDADQFEADIDIQMRPDGTVAAEPVVVAVRGPSRSIGTAMAESAKRAIIQCQAYAFLPKQQYDTWKYLPMTFGLKDMESGEQAGAYRAAPDSLRVENGGRVKMVESGGIYRVPVVINGALKLDFIVDSGASDVSIPADVVLTLMRTGTIKRSDFIGTSKYGLADGSTVESRTFIISSLKVGDRTVTDVRASISDVDGPLLLGQSFLSKFKSWSQDNVSHELVLQ